MKNKERFDNQLTQYSHYALKFIIRNEEETCWQLVWTGVKEYMYLAPESEVIYYMSAMELVSSNLRDCSSL